jgi:hypothetical protein
MVRHADVESTNEQSVGPCIEPALPGLDPKSKLYNLTLERHKDIIIRIKADVNCLRSLLCYRGQQCPNDKAGNP